MKRSGFAIVSMCFALADWGSALGAGLPIYPGATKMVYQGPTTFVRCGHKISVVTYYSSVDAKSVIAWYSGHFPGSIRVEHSASGGAGLTMTEVFEPKGTLAVAITPAGGNSGVRIGLGTYDPALSSGELKTMQALMGSDSAAKQRAVAEMKAKSAARIAPAVSRRR